MSRACIVFAGTATALTLFASVASAQSEASGSASVSASGGTTVAPTTSTTVGAGQPAGSLPPPQSSHDAPPPVAAPVVASTGVTEQAGIGGTQAYGRAGVLELGGFANFTAAKSFTQVGFNPTIGWFFMDNFQISAIVGLNYVNKEVTDPINGNTIKSDGLQMTLLAEPSFHLPFSQTFFGFLGVGAGLAYQKPGPGAGFALAPRLGVNVLVGRSGIFTPALQFVYQTTDAIQTPAGTAVAVSTTYGLNMGYTVMW